MDLFIRNEKNENSIIDFCEVYLLYFDESKGPIPLLIYPDESFKDDLGKMRLIYRHPIWFLDIENYNAFNRIDLEYNGKIYFAKKFSVSSKRKKRRAGLNQNTPETIILIIAIPTDIDIFGSVLLNRVTETIKTNFKSTLYQIIESEIAKDEIIKTFNIKEIIQKGDLLKNRLRKLIEITCKEYLKSVIEESDTISIKLQKALSYFILKGADITKIFKSGKEKPISELSLFEPLKDNNKSLELKDILKILNVEINQETQEIEIIMKNIIKIPLIKLRVKITYIQEFFEKELLNEKVEIWYSDEEILFISPVIPGIDDYLLYIIEENNKKIIFSKKIELNKSN
ncbi:MAG: hypothetical protein ACFFAH_10010 [Promethearchaeota archaeon]